MKNQIRKLAYLAKTTTHKSNACFIHIPKTGGTSLLKAYPKIIKYNGPNKIKAFPNRGYACFGHYSLDQLRKVGAISDEYWNTAKFATFVRNPYWRAVSVFEHYKRNNNVFWEERGDSFANFLNMVQYDMYRGICKPSLYQMRASSFAFPQSGWLKGIPFDQLHIAKIDEGTVEDIHLWTFGAGMKYREIPHVNKGEYQMDSISKYHTRLINKIYHDDFINFDYEKVSV